jgi:hypothetical protein
MKYFFLCPGRRKNFLREKQPGSNRNILISEKGNASIIRKQLEIKNGIENLCYEDPGPRPKRGRSILEPASFFHQNPACD